MLSRLLIKNYALIDNLDISFGNDLNVITGETGAGKSIVLGALGLILGQRAEGKYFFNQQKKCIVEGFFNIGEYQLKDFFIDNDLDYENETVLRREIALDGKSRAFINDTPVTLGILKNLGQQLIDVHSQHATLEINNADFQLLVIDVVAEHQDLLIEYKNQFQSYKKNQRKLKTLKEDTDKAKADQDYYQFLFDELETASINEGEQENLEIELNSLSHSEEIKKNLLGANFLIDNSEESALPKLKEALTQIQSLEKYQPNVLAFADRLKSAIIEIKDINDELETLEQATSFNESRLDEINERLSLFYSLQKKHRLNNNEELINFKNELSDKLNKILFADEDLEKLENELAKSEKELQQKAEKISKNRAKVIPQIEKHILETLAEVGMNNSQLKIEKKTALVLDKDGNDEIKFLFNANKGHQLNELNKVASGGELSRLMLSIKSLIAKKTALPTIIFDEIDTGVSGEVANRVGIIMEELAKNMQVITITHLPQMASKGKAHYFVYKATKDDFTYTQIKRLNEDERILEIAKMLSGENPKESALQNARELLYN
ncbi:DNA repair protein RecN [Pedobacter psychrophilus]|uniref:DNA repair protein RecN n=1 Tax=Pedobacter psychrophilus TaxID=1826909 RepID=A0A179DMD1_9SPHI|nr:DNA repair protein RecN [Pedobacter psychrophilus]OAQ42217.1 DNA repair protein RecN [Pedobacter psychrophilus]